MTHLAVAAPGRRPARLRWLPPAVGLAASLAGAALVVLVVFLVAGVRSGPVDWGRLLTSRVWDAQSGQFGATAMLFGTAAVAVIALALAAPVGWAAAIAIVELAPSGAKSWLRGIAELLAVVPSIVYGLIGIAYVRPFVASVFSVPGGDSLLAAGLVLSIMVLPTVIAVSADALTQVPAATREAAAACGLTRTEVIRAAVLPQARRGMTAAVLLALARALGETIAVFLVVGRADGRFPSSLPAIATRVIRPGQTLTTKLNGPESVLAGTSGAHWAALCALGLILLMGVAVLTVLGQRRADPFDRHRSDRRRSHRLRGAARWRHGRDRVVRGALVTALAGVLVLVGAIAVAVARRAGAAFDPSFWLDRAVGSSGGGIRNQMAGTVLLVLTAGALAAPVGLGLGLVVTEYAGRRTARWLRSLTFTLGGVPSILLGLCGYWLFSVRLGWGRSWLAGAIVLAVVAVPPVVIAVSAALASLPPERREAALGLGLRQVQVVRSVLVPHALPGLATGLLLGLARAAGETAPLLFTAAVFSGAPTIPSGLRNAPVATLPTHIFTLAQDASEPAATRAAWGAALVLILVAGLLVLAAVPARRLQSRRAT